MFSRIAQLKDRIANISWRRLSPARPVWIFGAGKFGQALCRVFQWNGLEVCGFVETAPKLPRVMDLPVLSWPDIAANGRQLDLVLGIFNRDMPFDELVHLASSAGFPDIFMPWEVYDQFGADLGWRYWLGSRQTLIENLGRIDRVAALLADEESRHTLRRICAFRLGLDLHYASYRATEKQYFNALTLPHLSEREVVYVDCGAYDGDTLDELLSEPGISCARAYLLEPDPDNYRKLASNAPRFPCLTICLPLAADENNRVLKFSSGQGEAGAITDTGEIYVATAALDQLLGRQRVDFMKIDVEGAEAQVIRGARQVISHSMPVIAMSLYHRLEDIWVLPEYLLQQWPDYRIYARQHYSNSFDCVLYAIPPG